MLKLEIEGPFTDFCFFPMANSKKPRPCPLVSLVCYRTGHRSFPHRNTRPHRHTHFFQPVVVLHLDYCQADFSIFYLLSLSPKYLVN